MDLPWEDYLLERKTEGDLRDLLKTMVAFANSVKPNHVATILIGEKDDGTIKGVTNPDNIQKKIREEAEKIYPPIIWRLEVYEKSGQYCVRVEIEYSGDTPHFGGIAWVRRGSETIKASDEVFQSLIDCRTQKTRELAKWLEKDITFSKTIALNDWQVFNSKLVFVNNFWATFDNGSGRFSEPLERLSLSYDDSNQRLKVILKFQ